MGPQETLRRKKGETGRPWGGKNAVLGRQGNLWLQRTTAFQLHASCELQLPGGCAEGPRPLPGLASLWLLRPGRGFASSTALGHPGRRRGDQWTRELSAPGQWVRAEGGPRGGGACPRANDGGRWRHHGALCRGWSYCAAAAAAGTAAEAEDGKGGLRHGAAGPAPRRLCSRGPPAAPGSGPAPPADLWPSTPAPFLPPGLTPPSSGSDP